MKLFHMNVSDCGNISIFSGKMPKMNTKPHIWNEADMKLAINAIIGKKMGYVAASKHVKFLRSTFFRNCIQKK